MFETYNKSYIFQNLVWMRKDDFLLYHLVAVVQMAPFVASPTVRVIQPVQMINDDKFARFLGKFIATISKNAPYLNNVEGQDNNNVLLMGMFGAHISKDAPYLSIVDLAKPSD